MGSFANPPFRTEVVKDPEELLVQNYFTPGWVKWIQQVADLLTFSGLAENKANNLPGYTGTVTTAALTGGGTQGSMTFANGILVSQTPAT